MQALNSLLFPVSEAPDALQLADALQQTIITSECVGVMLQALQVSSAAYEEGARLIWTKNAISQEPLAEVNGCPSKVGLALESCIAFRQYTVTSLWYISSVRLDLEQ